MSQLNQTCNVENISRKYLHDSHESRTGEEEIEGGRQFPQEFC